MGNSFRYAQAICLRNNLQFCAFQATFFPTFFPIFSRKLLCIKFFQKSQNLKTSASTPPVISYKKIFIIFKKLFSTFRALQASFYGFFQLLKDLFLETLKKIAVLKKKLHLPFLKRNLYKIACRRSQISHFPRFERNFIRLDTDMPREYTLKKPLTLSAKKSRQKVTKFKNKISHFLPTFLTADFFFTDQLFCQLFFIPTFFAYNKV